MPPHKGGRRVPDAPRRVCVCMGPLPARGEPELVTAPPIRTGDKVAGRSSGPRPRLREVGYVVAEDG